MELYGRCKRVALAAAPPCKVEGWGGEGEEMGFTFGCICWL